jgi:hypothetical protein
VGDVRKIIYFIMGEVQLLKFTQLKKVGRDSDEIVATEVSVDHLKERR